MLIKLSPLISQDQEITREQHQLFGEKKINNIPEIDIIAIDIRWLAKI